MTTHFDTARGYAKGGGAVRKLVLSPNLILENTALSLNDVCDFVTSVVVKSKQKDILERIVQIAGRNLVLDKRTLLGSDQVHVHSEVLINLCVNGDLALGARGQALAEFLVDQGIDAAFSNRTGSEFWGTAYNPKCIEEYSKVTPKDVPLALHELPSPFVQMTDSQSISKLLHPNSEMSINP